VYIFNNRNIADVDYNKYLTISLFSSALLSFGFIFANAVDDINFFILFVILFVIFLFNKRFKDTNQMMLLLIFSTVVMICSGYIIYSFILIGIYYLLINNHFFININPKDNDIENVDNNNE
tara:strand:- start:54 stop:416 length:363 start_codon:yes stop_codon:yes gene_type:complete